MRDSQTRHEKYDMREYWSKRANYYNKDEFQSICAFGAPLQFNQLMDRIQKRCFLDLLKQIPDIKDKKVLEVGCGIGRWAEFLTKRGIDYTGIDISPKMVKVAKQRVLNGKFFVSSGETLDFEDETFDLAFSITVLHHIPYEGKLKMIKEISRVVKKGGYIITIEDICLEKPKETFNMFPLTLTEWVDSFEGNQCQCLVIKKHKFLMGRFLRLTKILPRLTNNKLFLKAGELVEMVSAHIMPWKFFQGRGGFLGRYEL